MFIRKDDKIIGLYGKMLDIITLPKAQNQHNSDRYTIALIIVHDLSKHPDTLDVQKDINTFEEESKIPDEYWNSYTKLCGLEVNKRNSKSEVYEILESVLSEISQDIMSKSQLVNFDKYKDILDKYKDC